MAQWAEQKSSKAAVCMFEPRFMLCLFTFYMAHSVGQKGSQAASFGLQTPLKSEVFENLSKIVQKSASVW